MITEMEKYFIPNEEATFVTRWGNLCLQSIEREGNERIPKAIEQAKLTPVPVKQVIAYVNEFLQSLCDGGDKTEKRSSLNLDGKEQRINLGGKEQSIIDRGIYVEGCTWQLPKYDEKKRQYVSYDEKYDTIKELFGLDYPNDIVWLKFTTDGYLGVVADSFDVNFSYDNTSGRLLKKLIPNKEWDSSFVVIFPITPIMKQEKTRKMIETGIGNYLLSKKVPIIDFYSHNNF